MYKRQERTLTVSGVGYAPVGGFTVDGVVVASEAAADLLAIARAGQLCNDAVLREQDGDWQMEGDPTEGALLTLAVKAGLDPAAETAQFRRTASIPCLLYTSRSV